MSAARAFKGVWFPAKLWLRRDLSLIEKAAIVEIDSLDLGPDRCFATNRHFAEFLGISPSRASEIINGLVRRGFVATRTTRHSRQDVTRHLWLAGCEVREIGNIQVPDPLRDSEAPIRDSEDPPSENTEYKKNNTNNTLESPLPPASGGRRRKRKFDYSPEFERWFAAYPKKGTSKQQAWQEYPDAVAECGGSDALLLTHLQAYPFDTREEYRFALDACRWLARRSWQDDPEGQARRIDALIAAEDARQRAAAPRQSAPASYDGLDGVPM